jgi:ubiquinone/menaquinone biosynthesis C-methylase UbiE
MAMAAFPRHERPMPRLRYLAGQFARPHGLAGRLWIGRWLDRIGGPMNQLALSELEVGRSDRVLEVGFGGGDLLARILAATAGDVTGVDISEAMVRRSARRFRNEIRGGRLRLLTGSAGTLPLADGSVDKAVSVNSIYFWPDASEAMREFARVLRPGGTLALCFEPAEELRKWPGHRFGFRLYEGAQVAALMERAGFGELRIVAGEGRKPDRFLCVKGVRK